MRGYILSGREKILDSGNLLRVKVHGGAKSIITPVMLSQVLNPEVPMLK